MKVFKGYKKRVDGKLWTRKDVLRSIVNDVAPIECRLESSSLYINNRDVTLIFEFISSNYAEKNEIDLNANIKLRKDNVEFEWVDLFHLIKSLQRKYERPLSIQKDEQWSGSTFQKQVLYIIKPLINTLRDPLKASQFLVGNKVCYEDISLQIKSDTDNEWILKSSVELSHWLNSRR
ncbi:MAG TPA: hypothetical protein VF575_04485 [Candidatus Saccharimonadales bacterium]|jgi:hypothetical protein